MTRNAPATKPILLPLFGLGYISAILANAQGLSLSLASLLLLAAVCGSRLKGLTAKASGAVAALLGGFVVATLFGLSFPSAPADPNHIYHHVSAPAQPARLKARLLYQQQRPQGSKLTLEAINLQPEAKRSRNVWGKVRIYVDKGHIPYQSGDLLLLRCKLFIPSRFGTPGEFNFPRYMAGRHIWVTGYQKQAQAIVLLRQSSPQSFQQQVQRWRSQARDRLYQLLPAAQACWWETLLLGNKSQLTDKQRQLLSHSGIAHLFAVSGLHLAVLCFWLYLLLRAAARLGPQIYLRWPRPQLFAWLAVPVGGLYLALTGYHLATWRAWLMLMGVAWLVTRKQQVQPGRILMVCALAMLLMHPLAVYEPGWQLSFAAVAGLLWGLPAVRPWLQPLPFWGRWLLWPLVTSMIATLTTAPLIIGHFHHLAWIAPLINVLAVPLVSGVLLPAGILASLLEFAGLKTVWLWQLLGPALQGFMKLLSQFLHQSNYQSWWLYCHPAALWLGALCLLGLICAWQQHSWRWLVLPLAACMLFLPGSALPPRSLTLTVLAVGQGEALLITTPQRRHILVDAGGLPHSRMQVGERLVAPALGYLGASSLDRAFLSHRHPDHYLGFTAVLERLKTDHFISNCAFSALPPALKRPLKEQQIPHKQALPGWWCLQETEDYCFWCWRPSQNASRNNRSLALYLAYRDKGILLTGDLETPGLQQLLAHPLPGPVDVLKLPHHGSDGSAPNLLLNQTQPQLAVVSVGAHNPYHLPGKQWRNLLQKNGIPLWQTAQQGTIRLTSRGYGWRVQTWQQGRFVDTLPVLWYPNMP